MSAIALTLGSLRSQGRLIENSICNGVGIMFGCFALTPMAVELRAQNAGANGERLCRTLDFFLPRT